MATETPPGRCATMATETPPMAIETPADLCATMATETPPMATETRATMATETPPMAIETLPGRCATMATKTSPSRCAFVFIVMASTVPILVMGYFLISTLLMLRRGDPKCENPRLDWDLWLDAFLLLLFLVGSIGVLFKMQAVQVTCIILLILTSILILVIGWGIDLGGTFAKDTKRIDDAYRLETYGPLAKKFLLKDRGWSTFRNCLIERKICDKLDKRDFVQGGCCMPPSYCGYEQKNQTWVIPQTGRYVNDVNCVRWDSDERKLCYDCETCQAVYIYTSYDNWTFRGLGPCLGALVLIACFFFSFPDEFGGNNRSGGRANNNRSGGCADNNQSGGRADSNRSV
ncbi:tetraspanin-8-like [Rhododendron vialii]|uniref:tetraspanin-8-like n=1 Tax=Rhododendron vialii TaxID=182163 RepID=UPI00265E4957|nr:tetraspanin-8-like [Rhododendron vialii]